MGLKIRLCLTTILLLSIVPIVEAAWEGPVEVISGIWGSGTEQFGLRSGDSEDTFPLLNVVTPDGKIVITDSVNKKQLVFSIQSNFIKEVQWIVKSREGGRTVYDVPEYSFGPVVGFSADGNISTSSGGKYFLVTPTGQLIRTSTTRPLELGKVNSQRISAGQYKSTITYPGAVYQILADQPVVKYYRDSIKNIYQIETFTETVGEEETTSYKVHKYNKCSKKISTLSMPRSQYEPMPPEAAEHPTWVPVPVMEYGEPLVAPNGEVYAWARTKTQYKILKWTWVDDPNVPTGPDAPTGLSVMPSTTGLYLTWVASPQDPGCVTGYEIAHASSSGGVYSTVATLEKGAIKYNDTTAATGTTHYYKIRAVAGSEYSPYTSEVSGKR